MSMITAKTAITKLRRPPSVPNWVRYMHQGTHDSAIAMTKFALSNPRLSLAPVYKLASDIACRGTPLEQVLKGLQTLNSQAVRRLGTEILTAFASYNIGRRYDGIETLPDFCVNYPLGRGVVVPVKPTFVIMEEGGLTPVFVIGWTSIPFSDFQKKLLSTIIYNSILTLTDFIGRDAEIVCLPRATYSKYERMPRSWKVSHYKPYTGQELTEILDRYGSALDLASIMIKKILGDNVE